MRRRILPALCLTATLGLTTLPAQAADAPVTPTAPVVVDECGLGNDRVRIPDIAGVQYLIEVDGQTIELTPGDYAGILFLPEDVFDDSSWGEGDDDTETGGEWVLPDSSGTITAEAKDGSTLAEGAVTSFDVSLSSAPCASETSLVTATSTGCGTLTFTNPAGNPEALVMWVDAESLDDYAEVRVPAGTSRTISTDATDVDWFAVDEATWDEVVWEDELGGSPSLGATVPDLVATQEDRDLLVEVARALDLMLTEGLGGGFATVEQDCATPPVDEPSETPAPTPSTPTSPAPTTPEIPAVVQTDGIGQG